MIKENEFWVQEKTRRGLFDDARWWTIDAERLFKETAWRGEYNIADWELGPGL